MATAAPVVKSEAKVEAKIDQAKVAAAAEKAYADAAAQIEAKSDAPAAPAAPKAEVKPAAAAPVAVKVAGPKQAPAKTVVSKKAATKTVAAPKKITKKTTAKKTVKKVVKVAAKPAAKPAAPTIIKLKDTIMTKTKTATTDFTAKMQDAVTEAQTRAKVALEKSQVVFADAGEFAKGNVEALVASGKILAAGLQDVGKDYVAEAKSALETVQADVKELTAVKSPADFFKLQGEILRRNFDASVASASKHSEMVVKLAGDAFAPISTRVSLAVEKVKQAA